MLRVTIVSIEIAVGVGYMQYFKLYQSENCQRRAAQQAKLLFCFIFPSLL